MAEEKKESPSFFNGTEYKKEDDLTALADDMYEKESAIEETPSTTDGSGFGNYKETKDYYHEMISLKPTYAQYNCIGGMPPSFDNYVDPPVDFFGSRSSINNTTGMNTIGMDFTEACIVRGQFINLIPIDIKFRGLSSIGKKAVDLATTTFSDITFDTEEVMQSQLRWAEYWNTVNYHFRACVMMLDMVNVFGNMKDSGGVEIPGFKDIKTLLSPNSDVEVAVDDSSWFGAGDGFLDADGGRSMLKAICSMTAVDRPMIPFYVDGFIETNDSASTNIGESAIFGAWKQAGEAMGAPVDIVKEWAQHSSGPSNSTMLWNPVVPKIFKDFSIERVHTYKHKLISIGSDPLSILLYVLRVLCQYFPFIRPRAASGSLNTYRTPFYVQAFSKGTVNVKFGVIQSVEITRDPQFITAQGIPTQLELNVSLCSLSTMEVLPNMDGAWASLFGDASYPKMVGKEGAAINYLATLCGLNAYNISFMGRFRLRLKRLQASMAQKNDLMANVSKVKADIFDKFF